VVIEIPLIATRYLLIISGLSRGVVNVVLKKRKLFFLCRYLGLPFPSIAYLLAGDIHRQQELSGDKKATTFKNNKNLVVIKNHTIYKNNKITFLRGPLKKNEELF